MRGSYLTTEATKIYTKGREEGIYLTTKGIKIYIGGRETGD